MINVQRYFVKEFRFILAVIKIIENYYWNFKIDFCFLLKLLFENHS